PVAFTASPKRLPLAVRVLEKGEYSGFTARGSTGQWSTARAWVTTGQDPGRSEAAAMLRRLQREGFKAAHYQAFEPATKGRISRASGYWSPPLPASTSA